VLGFQDEAILKMHSLSYGSKKSWYLPAGRQVLEIN